MPTVTVACKLPNGLFLELEGRERVVLKGTAVPHGFPPVDVGGYALTPNVDADFFVEWMAEYKNYAPVREGLIYAYAKPQDATARAMEMRDLKSGLEPLDPDKPGPGLERVGA